MTYTPQVDDYVIWHHNGLVHQGWVYFVDEKYITIETGIKPKPNCQYTKNEKHKYIHTLLLCHPYYWKDLEYIKHRRVLCNHCGRTADNNVRCLGMCVADSDY